MAQQRQLSSGDRMRLVSGLRDEIDRRRAKFDPDTPAAVRRILERIGTPEEVLDTLGARSGQAAAPAPGRRRRRPAPASRYPSSGLRGACAVRARRRRARRRSPRPRTCRRTWPGSTSLGRPVGPSPTGGG
ncbi:hypothetical protein WKI68_25215 [Streptomyces sp. MS1.HAVA.3]|uniref:Uncharacterized protein n=1 Tax=Streptomyces caledonius TaxID=3134107 RepID=A0ABU8U7D8_9ACTN